MCILKTSHSETLLTFTFLLLRSFTTEESLVLSSNNRKSLITSSLIRRVCCKEHVARLSHPCIIFAFYSAEIRLFFSEIQLSDVEKSEIDHCHTTLQAVILWNKLEIFLTETRTSYFNITQLQQVHQDAFEQMIFFNGFEVSLNQVPPHFCKWETCLLSLTTSIS